MKRVAVMALVLMSLACRSADPTPTADFKIILGPKATRTIRNADLVRAWRIGSPRDPQFAELKRTHPQIEGFPILEEKQVSEAIAKHLAAALLDARTYHNPTACEYDPHHTLLFQHGRDSVVIIVCVACGDIDVLPAASLRERRVWTSINGPSDAMYEAMYELFPRSPPTAR